MFKKKFPSLSSLGSDGNTAFLRAARAGHLDKVLEHLKSNIDINTSNTNGLNALHLASKDGHVNVVTELLKRGAAVDAATKKGNTALHIASLAGQEEVVKLLVANGAAVNVQSQNGFTPLYMAAQENHDNVVRFLLANGANQSLATEDGFTPLAVAMQQGHDKVVAVLLENDTRGKVRLPALHIAAKKDDCKAAALLLQNDHNPDVTSKSGFTPLHIAAHYGNESIANLLLNRGADVNYSAKHNITPLHVAAKWGKTNMVSLLLEKGANIESKTRDGLTPLHCAARSGHEQVVDMMLERGAPISSKTKNGLAPLHMASQGDHVDAARILLYHRAPVDEVTVDYLTALHVAAHCGHVRVAKLLLDRKADPNARALNGFTPLHIACKKNRIKVVELLLKHGASIEATTESGLTPLHVASFMGCMNIVIYLLQHDASPDVPTVRGETPLHLAARANQTDIIRILLRNGAQVDARAREQQTPLHIASRLGNVDIVMLLLQHGAAVDSTTKDMYTALHIAAKEGQEEVASVLLEHGASLTATTKKGFTPLHLAAKYGNMKVAKLLLQRDAPVDAQGKNGVTPLHVASHYDHQNVALLLLDKGASPHATAKNGHTPLHIAARKNQMDIATTLLEYGAKANAESKAGFTPLHLSSQEGHTDMSTLLIEHQADTNHKAKNGLTPLHLCAQEDRVNVASILVKNGAEVDSRTKAGYTPLHVASHFGHGNMVRFLLQQGGDVKATTSIGYTPLHQAAQQGHTTIVNLLLENSAPPNSLTNQGQTPLSIAQKLGYISVVETLKVVTEPTIPSSVAPGTEEKYRVVAPETMQETFMSDSEDEGGEDTMLSDQPYRYLTVDEMKSLGDDSLPIDVTRDERVDSNRECMAPPTAVDDTISPQHAKENYSQFTAVNYTPDNIDINRHPVHVGFLVSFLVDARGGAMRGCRHSGVRVIVPPRKASMPMRVTCRYLKRDKLSHPPPLMEGEALASRILELGPVGAKFLGPVIIEVPHFGSLRGMEREIVILRSDNGETWREHTLEASEEAVHDVLNESFEGEELTALEEMSSGRMTRILTTDFPQYFAVVSRIRQEVHAIGPEGGMVSSSVVPQVQAVFPQGALTKKIKVGLQAQPIAAELAAKLLGNRVAVSPIVTVEPRRRKFHKPITLTIPVPQAANKGMINQYSGDAPTLRLLCSITGGTTRAQWEDVTGSTPLTFVNDCVSFTTTVSARFWLMDCRNIGEATKMATELYKEAIHVPFMAKFVVFAKRVDILEARLRVFCMTDDKEDKTLEHQEHFTEVAKSRDVEVLEGKPQYIEFAGNLVPVTKSGDQLQLGFRAFRENRLPFTVRVKDPHADTVGRILFMREPKVAKGEPPQQPICILNIVLPETILPETTVSEPDLLVLHKKYSFLRDGGLGRYDTTYQRTDLRLSDISNLLGEDWVPLANELGITTSKVNLIKSECPTSVAQQAMAMLRLWLQQSGNKATGNVLETALRKIGRDDIVQQCIFNVDEMDRAVEKVQLDQSGFDSLKEELGPSRDASLRRDASLDITYDEQDIMKESESVEELVQAEKKEPLKDKAGKEPDVDETKYIGEEKVVEEERKTVAQLKEIFAQDKRDRQYERQPPVSEQQEIITEKKEEVTKIMPQESKDILTSKAVTAETRTITVTKVEKDISKPPPVTPSTKRTEEIPTVPVRTDADQRRDSELFQGVSEGLVRLETTYKVIPSQPEIMSPKVSKTPPPSPAEFKDMTGTTITTTATTLGGTTTITTTKTTTVWQQPEAPPSAEQQSPMQEWTEKEQPTEKEPRTTKSESTRPLTGELKDRQEPQVAEPLVPTPTPRHIPKPESREDLVTTSPMEPVGPISTSGEVSPAVSHISIHRVSVGISPSDALEDSKVSKTKHDEAKPVEEDIQSYSDRKKFWEQMTTTGQAKPSDSSAAIVKQRTLSQESVAPPVPKPRSSIPSPAPLISVLQESGIIKSEAESDTETTTFSDSTIRMHPPPASVSKQSTFTGSSDTSDREGSETEAADTQTPATGEPTTAESAVAVLTKQKPEEEGSSDSEAEYLAKCGDEPLAYENTAFVSDEDIDRNIQPEQSLKELSTTGITKKMFERSVSLPTEDLLPFDANGSSVRAKKRYFEAQIKKEMVVEQLMTQLEEEASPEHKSIHQAHAKPTPDQEKMVTRQIHSDIFSHALEETIESAVPEQKDIISKEELEEIRTVKDIAKGFEKPKAIKDEKITAEVKVLTKKSSLEQESKQEREMLIEKEESKATIVKQLAKGFEIEPSADKTSATSEAVKPSEEKEHPEAETKVSSVKALAKGFEKIEVKEAKLIKDIMQTEKSKAQTTEEHKDVTDICSKIEHDAEDESKLSEEELASEIKRMDSEEDPEYKLKGPIDLVASEEISEQVAEVMHYKTETISKPSDSLEVHVDKSETEETEKERDIDEDLKVMEMKQAEEEGIPSITVTLSGKQRTESYSQGESEDTQSESDVTPEDTHGDEHTLYQPEEHVHDTVWEVPVQEQPETIIDEMVQEIPIEKQIILEKDEELETQKITKDEAKVIAEEVVESIEAEVAKRATLIGDIQEAVSPPVPPPEMAETQVTEYLRQLAGKEELEPREVQLMESVLARKHREEMKKLSRTDTATSSMEITDEDLRSSGVETDLSPLESQAGPHLQECASSEDTEIPQEDLKLQDEEVVEKTLAEVRESLEAAQEQLIEQHKQKEEIIQKKESPSEFEFKVLTFEKTIDESIEESHYEEVSATADFAESVTSGQILKHTAEATIKSKDDTYEECKKTEGAEISFGKDGIELQKDIVQQEKDRHEVKTTDSTLEDVAIITSDTEIPVGEQRISAAFSDEEECSLSSKLTETETKDKTGGIVCTTVKEEKEATASTSEEKVVIETKLGEIQVDSSYEKEDITKAQSTVTKKEEKETKVEETKETKTGTETKTVITEGQKGSRIFQETVFEKVTSSTVIGKDAHSKETFSVIKASEEIPETCVLKESDKKTEEATKAGMRSDITRAFKVESEIPETALTEKMISFLPEVVKTPSDSEKVTEKEEMKRTSSEESQRSLSQDESTKSPVDSSSSSGRRTEATELIRTVERPDGSETTVVVLRHPQPPKSTDADSSSSGERGATLRTERRSGADFEAWSSSGESHYHSFEQTSESGRTYSRPCSSDVEALMGGVGTAGSSEYESALTSQEISARSTSVTSHEYHTAVSSLSSRDSMKSLDSESSGHLASIEVSSEASETLVPSALELEKDMEGTGALAMDEDDVERQDFVLSCPPVIEESLEESIMVEPYDTAIPVHIIRGESPPSILDYDKHDGASSYLQDVAGSSGMEKIDDGHTSPFEILDFPIEETVSEDETEIHDSRQQSEMEATLDGTTEDERPHCMKRSHEMIFQPEPRPIITESPLSETAIDLQEEKLGSSVEEGSVLSVSLSSASDAVGLTTVIEVSRAESEQMAISGSSEQLDLEDLDAPAATQLVDSGTCTYSPSTSAQELHLSSVTITTSSVEESGVQSVCTQVTSQSHTPVQEEAFGDDEEDGTQREQSQMDNEDEYPQSNGPTQVEYVPEYDDYDDSRKRHMGHRRKESTSTFVPSKLPTMTDEAPKQVVRPIPELSPMKSETDEMAESDKYTETGPMTLKEVRSDEKKDVDEAERLEESYQTEADQGFHRDLREGRVILEDVISIEDEPEAEFDTSRPQSQVSKSDSEGGHRPMSSGFSDDRPDSELAELLKQCSESGKDLEDPIERPMSPEPADECEIKDDTPEFSSEAQASITELEMEYSGAFSRSVEYASHVSPIREERVGVHYEEAYSTGEWTEPTTDHEEEMAEAEAAFQMAPHAHSMMTSLPPTIPEDPLAEKHELETRDKDLRECKAHKEAVATSPGSIPDITVTQHMTPLVDRGFHYPDLELEEEAVAKSTPQTPASVSSRASSETETDQGREYILEDEEQDDFISEEPELEQEDKQTESRSVDEVSAAEDKTVYETGITADKKEEPPSPTTESPESDSFEMLEKPDLTDEYVVIEEVGKEAEEHDTEGKSVQIGKKIHSVKKTQPKVEEDLISSPPAPATRMTDIKYYPEPGEDMGPFPFDSDSPPTAATTTKSVGVRAKGYGYEAEEYDREVEAGKKWIEMQFQGNGAATVPPGYGYEMEFERGPLEDIKEEEINDFDQSSSKVGSMGSYKGSIGSFGSVKESLSSTPEYDVLAGRKFFTRSGEHDDVSMSSLQEFEQLERQIALESARKRSHGSQDSLNGAKKSSYGSGSSGRSGQGDDISLSSLKEFEGLETLCIEAAKIETRAKEEEALLSEIEEGHESQISESESCETMSVGGAKGILGGGGESVDSDDYEKRIFEIDEIIRQAQSNVERFVDIKERDDLLDKTESVGRGDSMEEVARVPELDLDQPLYSQHGVLSSSFTSKVAEATGWRDASEDIVKTSSDSLDLKDRSQQDPLHTSTDSLDMKTVADKSGDVMTTSADSIEFQVPGQGDIMTDSMELPIDTGESAVMATSTDSLDLGATGAAIVAGTAMTDSIEEEEEMSILGQAEGQGSGSGGQDQSSSSGREGDLSSSGRDDNSGEQGRVPPPRADMMLGSTDSLEPSSSTATHATYQYETDSVMSSSFTSGGSNTMVSSTDTLDPTGAAAGGIDAIDLAAAARSAGVWFEEGSGKPFVTEVIEPSEGDEFSHTIRRTVELPPEVRKVSFKGPDAERALKEYVEQFAPGEDVTETQEVDAEGNVHIKRVVQRRVVVRTEDLADIEVTGPEIEEYLRKVAEQRKDTQEDDVPESDYTHLMTSITGSGEPFPSSQSTEVVTHQTYVTRHMIPSVTHGAVVSTTKQGLTYSTPNLTGTMAMSDWEQEKAAVSGDAPDVREEGEGSDSPGVRRSVEQTTDTRVVDGGTVTRTVTTTTTTTTVHGDSGSMQKLKDETAEEEKPSPKKSE